jgi:hypothetical protein
MIQKLSRKKDPKTGKRRNLGTFKTRAAAVRLVRRESAKIVTAAVARVTHYGTFVVGSPNPTCTRICQLLDCAVW